MFKTIILNNSFIQRIIKKFIKFIMIDTTMIFIKKTQLKYVILKEHTKQFFTKHILKITYIYISLNILSL